ncbi:hypothetical protein K1T71_007205 [Dendrolimus kikuchii]|uniref:Uncharacterized protein n=1 Tax=Dendrolimus kikuchii TaxID=765133 RepID=A0ACC1CZS0_9NEOP|nr:hypothetical protein K1T71_007205 [Dendrolimus kikuchii]
MVKTALLKILRSICPKNLAWNGGPLHLQCEHGIDLWTRTGEYVKENVIAIKAVTFKDEIYLITPRMKHGVLATVWLLVRTKRGVELEPYPELRSHKIADCSGIQNAVDVYLDHLGNLWILDSGIIDTLESPRCTCPPKVVVISLILDKLISRIDISYLAEPNSLLQSLVVEYDISGKSFLYVSDASRGSVLVHEIPSGSEWSAIVCQLSAGLQLALVKRGPMHSILILLRLHQHGLFELDTGALRRRNSMAPLRVFGEHSKPMVLLGADAHHIYFRHTECSDVLSWDTRDVFNVSELNNIHSAGPRLTPTSVAADPLKHLLIILDSNYADSFHGNTPTYHKISFTGQT